MAIGYCFSGFWLAAGLAHWLWRGLRAIAAACEERGILIRNACILRTSSPPRRLGARFPGQSADLAAAARLFDQVRYGGGAGSPDGYERLRQLDEALASQQPTPVHGTEPAALAGWPASARREPAGDRHG